MPQLGPNDAGQVFEDPQRPGVQKVWTGSGWMDFKNPNAGVPSGRTDAQDLDTFKNGATGLGALASLFAPEVTAPLKVGISAIGGMMGRGLAHGAAATSHAPQDASLGEDLAKGAAEGGMGEAGPLGVGNILKYGGKGMRAIGESVPGNLWERTIPAEAVSEWMLGLPRGAGAAAATIGPPVMRGTGKAAEWAGNAINGDTKYGRTSSQILRDAWRGLTGGGEEVLSPAEKYAAEKGSTRPPSIMDSGPRPGGSYQRPDPGVADGEIIPAGEPKWNGPAPPASLTGVESPKPSPTPAAPSAAAPMTKSTKLADSSQGTDELESLMDAMHGPDAPTAGNGAMRADMPPSLRELPRRDEVWGPGSVDQGGGVAQADFSRANLKYDPQTPTSYLREQLSTETDPAQREFLVNAINQRRKLEAATAGIK